MYQHFFGLCEEPFGVTPDPRFFFESEQHLEAAATLIYAIQQRRGFALLLGRAGLGKTSVLVHVVQHMKDQAVTAYLPHPYFDKTNVLEAILLALGVQPEASAAQNHRLFHDFLCEQRQAGKNCVVIFDEAQDLTRDTLEAIRMLSNFEQLSEKLVQIVLAGQPGLAETLKQPDCEQIRQRCTVVARLRPLDGAGVREYIKQRLTKVGGSIDLFAPEAVDSIVSASQGVPRNVNTICFNSLTLAFAESQRQVTFSDVDEALRDLDLNVISDSVAEIKPDMATEAIALVTEESPSPAPLLPEEPVLRFSQETKSYRPAWLAVGIAALGVGLVLIQSLIARPSGEASESASHSGSSPKVVDLKQHHSWDRK